MSRPIAVLRPEPGNRMTAAAVEGRGQRAVRLPLFAVRAMAWDVPHPSNFDALLLTSANAVRWGGEGLAALRGLPVHAVGAATAAAAMRAGFGVVATGRAGAEALVAQATALGVRRALYLAGREHMLAAGGIVAAVVPVYASDPVAIPAEAAAELAGTVALVQSARAGVRLGEIVEARSGVALVAASEAVAVAAGEGWERVAIAASPDSETLIDTAIALFD